MVHKCEKCGFEFTGEPRQCKECGTRKWRRIDSAAGLVSAPDKQADKSAFVTDKSPDKVTTDKQTDKADLRFVDSVAAPGIYQICRKHGKRYCFPCGTAVEPHPPASAQVWTDAAIAIQKNAAKAKRASA